MIITAEEILDAPLTAPIPETVDDLTSELRFELVRVGWQDLVALWQYLLRFDLYPLAAVYKLASRTLSMRKRTTMHGEVARLYHEATLKIGVPLRTPEHGPRLSELLRDDHEDEWATFAARF